MNLQELLGSGPWICAGGGAGRRALGGDGANERDRLVYTNHTAPLVGDRQSAAVSGMLRVAHSSLQEMNSRAVRGLDVECYSVRPSALVSGSGQASGSP